MRIAAFLLASALFVFAGSSVYTQEHAFAHAADKPNDHVLFDRVVENQKKSDAAMDVYERLERVEMHKVTGENQSTEVKVSRVVPAGTGAAHLPVGTDGKISDQNAYRAELEKLEKSLVWAAETGRTQHDAYERIAKKRKEREELIGAARAAFLFTLIGTEQRDGHVLLKYRMDPNPAFKPTSRATSIYPRVRGTVWIDEASGELARIEGEVTDDISLGLFLAKVYKGSHFMQERYEMVPGLWLPSFSQYDFDGRKFLSSFSLHERMFYSNYRRVGTPKEALELVRAELKGMRPGGVSSR
ncbi:MAG TPA: hypothetical protein VN974_04420 [Candidatus Dormibacteraeota bacterium]|nr:hypothetical protein [Candidatus Dormibacteraeota bacterium]